MSNNIVEILSIIVKKILDNDVLYEPDEELIQFLLDQGYPSEDIDIVLKIISGVYSDSYIDLSSLSDIELSNMHPRIITRGEKNKLTADALGILEKIQGIGFLDLQKIEYLFLVLFNTFELPIDADGLWDGLKQIFEDCELEVLSRIIPEFNDYNVFYKHHLN